MASRRGRCSRLGLLSSEVEPLRRILAQERSQVVHEFLRGVVELLGGCSSGQTDRRMRERLVLQEADPPGKHGEQRRSARGGETQRTFGHAPWFVQEHRRTCPHVRGGAIDLHRDERVVLQMSEQGQRVEGRVTDVDQVDAGLFAHFILDLPRLRIAFARHDDVHLALTTSLQHRSRNVPTSRVRGGDDDPAPIGNAVVIMVRSIRARRDLIAAIGAGERRFGEAMRVVAENRGDIQSFLGCGARSEDMLEVCQHAFSCGGKCQAKRDSKQRRAVFHERFGAMFDPHKHNFTPKCRIELEFFLDGRKHGWHGHR